MAFFCLLWASLAFGILLGFWLVTNEQKRLVACRVFSMKTRTDAKGDAPTYTCWRTSTIIEAMQSEKHFRKLELK